MAEIIDGKALAKKIRLELKDEADKLKDLDYTEQWVLRHELVHAFLHESGLDKEAPWGNEGEELFVDWIALQLPKMVKAMKEAGAL